MNILVFSWRGPLHPLAGGAEQVMHEHMKGWTESGHSVTLFTSSFPGARESEEIDGIHVIRKGDQILTVHISAFFWYLFGKHKKFDLIIDQFHGIPFFTPLYIRTPKLAVVQEVAREVWLKNDLHFPWNKLVGFIGFHGEWFVYQLYRGVRFMTGSISAKLELEKVGISEKKIDVVPHGVIVPKVKKYPKEKVPTIIFLGALAKDKGIEDALKTFLLLKKNEKFQFWIVGRGGDDYVKYLKKLTQKYDISNDVTFFGFVSQKKKFELLSRAHILINPSLLEGWGLVNIEANIMETPVVAYKSPGLVDSVQNGKSGILVSKNKPTDLQEEIEKLLSDKETLKKLQSGAKQWGESFNWEKSKKHSLQLIESLNDKNTD